MTIKFCCANCGKSLTTSDEKAGRKARCPGCGDVLVVPVPEPAAAEAWEDWDGASSTGEAEYEEYEDEPAAAAPRRKSRACPMCGAKVSATARSCDACGERLRGGGRDSATAGVPAGVDVGRVLQDAWAIYKNNLGNLLGSFVINRLLLGVACGLVYALFAMLLLGGMVAVAGDRGPPQGDPPAAFFVVLFGGLLMMYVAVLGMSMVFELAWVRYSLLLVRGKQPEVSDALQGWSLALSGLLPLFVAGLMLTLGTLLLVLPGLALVVMLAFLWHVLADEKVTGLEAIGAALKLGAANFLPLLLLGLLGGLINLAGALCLGFGVLFSAPFVSLLFAVAYQQAQGKRVAV